MNHPTTQQSNEATVLLHGLARPARTMRKMARALEKQGYTVHNLGYPSTRHPIEELAAGIWAQIALLAPVNFVTDSMGGILLRVIARDHPGAVRRAVMIAPPNRGTTWVEKFHKYRLLRVLSGVAALQLNTDPDSLPNRLGAVDFPLGVIAGNFPDNPIAPFLFRAPNDGRVSVAQTTVDGIAAHIIFPYGHFYIQSMPRVIAQVIHFLDHARFAE
jgi:pimeloyl-ACP methyl ester carboxylesterase